MMIHVFRLWLFTCESASCPFFGESACLSCEPSKHKDFPFGLCLLGLPFDLLVWSSALVLFLGFPFRCCSVFHLCFLDDGVRLALGWHSSLPSELLGLFILRNKENYSFCCTFVIRSKACYEDTLVATNSEWYLACDHHWLKHWICVQYCGRFINEVILDLENKWRLNCECGVCVSCSILQVPPLLEGSLKAWLVLIH